MTDITQEDIDKLTLQLKSSRSMVFNDPALIGQSTEDFEKRYKGSLAYKVIATIEHLQEQLIAAEHGLDLKDSVIITRNKQLSEASKKIKFSGWIDIKDELPAVRVNIFITGIGPDGRFYADAMYHHDKFWLFDPMTDYHSHETPWVSHWKPIKPPSEG